jgi:hypothetical protein
MMLKLKYSIFIGAMVIFLGNAAAAEYAREVSKWQEISVPADTNQRERMMHLANYSKHEWRVYLDGDRICAQRVKEKPDERTDRPKFTPRPVNLQTLQQLQQSMTAGWSDSTRASLEQLSIGLAVMVKVTTRFLTIKSWISFASPTAIMRSKD